LVGKCEGKRPFGGIGTDWRIILKWILKIGWEGLDWIH
jgi:hypothetical protein